MSVYTETFDDGPGGWHGWQNNYDGDRPLEIRDGCVISRSPWWIDYNHAPPGAGYMHLLFILNTLGAPSERHRMVAGENRFIQGGFGTDFTNARLTLRLKGELLDKGTQLFLLCQGNRGGICSGWLLTGQPISVTEQWSEQTIQATTDEGQWTCLGSRHDRVDQYGRDSLPNILADVNADILLVLFPLQIAPMGPFEGGMHQLRPEQDYPVWRHQLPEGYVMLDEVRIEFQEQP